MWSFSCRVGLVVLLSCSAAWAQTTRPSVAQIEIGPYDVARSFQTFERTLETHPPTGDLRRQVNRRYDWLSGLVFRQQWTRAAQELARMTDAMLPIELDGPVDRAARATLIRLDPPIPLAGETFGISVKPMYDVERQPRRLPMVIRNRDKTLATFRMDPDGQSIETRVRKAGDYQLGFLGTNGVFWLRHEFSVVDKTPPALARELTARLDAAGQTSQAADVLRDRLKLLQPIGVEGRPASLVELPHTLARDLVHETSAVVDGRDPYVGKAGTYWATFAGLPAIVHVPSDVVRDAKRVPLVVALHGAGADENMFILGYGDGKLRRLADREGFILVSPQTYPLVGRGDRAVELVEALVERYPVDERRVYAVGHSLGAITLTGWTLGDPDGPVNETFAAVALVAGGGRPVVATNALPTFMLAAGRDRIFRVERLESVMQAVRDAGSPARFELYEDEGHVGIVQHAIGDAVDWLLEQQRPVE
ncbi:MAG: hypothetical protein AAF561_06185 [Planctomycetota bacterium]